MKLIPRLGVSRWTFQRLNRPFTRISDVFLLMLVDSILIGRVWVE